MGERYWRPGQHPVDHDDALELVGADGVRAYGTLKADSLVVKARVRVFTEAGVLLTMTPDDMRLLQQYEGRLLAVMVVNEYTDEPTEEQFAEALADEELGLPARRMH